MGDRTAMADTDRKYYLSKSRYVSGLQCLKMLWLQVHKPELAAPADETTERIFEIGHRVGRVAHELFPGGVLIDEDHTALQGAIASTRKAADMGAPAIFEATVAHNNVLCRADILKRAPGRRDRWDLYEVKSSTSVKPQYLPDIAVQRYCLEGAGFPIRKTFLVHIDSDYVRQGPIDPSKLLTTSDETENAAPHLQVVEANVGKQLQALASSRCPKVDPGDQCSDPYSCAFFAQCNGETGPGSIYELRSGGRAIAKLEKLGVSMLRDVPADIKLTQFQRTQVESARTRKPVVDRTAIARFLSGLVYPLHYFDFETCGSAIPLFDGSRPWQQVPFQFSLHVQRKPGGPCEHHSFLPTDRADPRPALIDAMLEAIQPKGSIVAWNMGFEKGTIESLAAAFPQYGRRLSALLPRFVDLIVPFRSCWYVDHRFGGRCSLKNVLPVMVPELSYSDLEIQQGNVASVRAEKWFAGDLNKKQWADQRPHMLRYCQRDTEGMVRIWEQLNQAAPAPAACRGTKGSITQ